MQSDAHVSFTKGWDVDIIEQMEATGDEMAVLSTYLTGKIFAFWHIFMFISHHALTEPTFDPDILQN